MAISGSAIAAETPSVEALEVPSETIELAQVATVDELSDVVPTDWAYTALQNLVETYGCIEGYPNRTFRGNNALTRYEFAAGLNSCLDVLTLLNGDGLDEGTLASIQRLQQEFQAELATLRGRVDALEAETAELRAQQFSTTTKLRGQVDANLVAPFGSATVPVTIAGNTVAAPNSDDNTTFTARTRLNFDASFTGEDRLRVRFQTGDDFASLQTAGGLANATDTSNSFNVDDFYYAFPVGSRLDLIIAANSINTDDFVVSTIVPFDGPSVADAGGPVLYDVVGGGGAAAGFSFALTDNFVLDTGYSAGQSTAVGVAGSNNANTGGIFGAEGQSSIAQLSFLTDGFFNGALTYINGTSDGATQVDTYAALASLDFGRFIIGGYWAQHDVGGSTTAFDDVSWQAGIAFPDLFVEGSQLGVYYADLATFAPGVNSYMYEGYYEIPVSQYLTITPALIYGDLDGGAGVDTENFYGAIRATFSF
jgi:hypothetical protein